MLRISTNSFDRWYQVNAFSSTNLFLDRLGIFHCIYFSSRCSWCTVFFVLWLWSEEKLEKQRSNFIENLSFSLHQSISVSNEPPPPLLLLLLLFASLSVIVSLWKMCACAFSFSSSHLVQLRKTSSEPNHRSLALPLPRCKCNNFKRYNNNNNRQRHRRSIVNIK